LDDAYFTGKSASGLFLFLSARFDKAFNGINFIFDFKSVAPARSSRIKPDL
jgi:hypothetical protein